MTERTIKNHLNSENHIRIARSIVKHLAGLLGCSPDSVKIEGNTSYIDFNQSVPLSIQCISNGNSPAMAVWQTANEIAYPCADDDEIASITNVLNMAGYDDAESFIAKRCLKRKTVLFDISEYGIICAECVYHSERQEKLEFRSSDKIAEHIFDEIKNDCEKVSELARKLKKAIKICDLEFEKLLNHTAEIMQSATKKITIFHNFSYKIY